MDLKEYRTRKGLTNRELTDELKAIDSRFTCATVSYMENGVVELPEAVKVWLAKKQIEANEEPLTQAEDIVIRCLTSHNSADNALSRSDLKYWSGLPDRVVRRAIEGLRNRGYWVLSAPQGGYYITFDPEELHRFIAREKARARSINRTVNAMLSRVPGQMEMREG